MTYESGVSEHLVCIGLKCPFGRYIVDYRGHTPPNVSLRITWLAARQAERVCRHAQHVSALVHAESQLAGLFKVSMSFAAQHHNHTHIQAHVSMAAGRMLVSFQTCILLVLDMKCSCKL